MKVLIEVDLPEGQSIPTADDIKRITSPDWLCEFWHIDDVKGCVDYDVTDDQAREVLELAERYHDCNIGINWEELQYHIDKIVNESENK